MTSGVYRIYNTLTHKSYVGSSGNIRQRWYRHRGSLRKGTHHSQKLQRAWDKYGSEAFTFEVLEPCPVDLLRSTEQLWLDTLDAYHRGYNCTSQALEHSEAVRARLSAMKQGRTPSEATRQRMSLSHKGQTTREEAIRRLHTPEARRKAADAKRGVPLDAARKAILAAPEVQAKAAARRAGVKRGPYKPSTGPDGRKRPLTPEHRAKLVGRVVSEETRRKQSEAAKNRRKRSPHA